ncbi:hypothetical protein LOK49_LG13G02156 [Camellia lanceoleosa]|uniref:Uncharacterized protein n=1 Tax=Camellia lanceoleosa TaxID=1840588 RepID=A0ACC0FH94_9ERIC|nr:hypothetical protein LOK49_LG13G02156 [Camellia lanceoleosa]
MQTRTTHSGKANAARVKISCKRHTWLDYLLSISWYGLGWRGGKWYADRKFRKEQMKLLGRMWQSLVGGELVRALLIQIQKLKLDIDMAMLELDQILKANEINFAILAALPAFFLARLLLMLVCAWLKQDTRAEGRGRIARLQRRFLIVEVEKRIMQFQICIDQGLITRLSCGGFVLAIQPNHMVSDELGLVQFLKATTDMAKGSSSSPP